MLGPLSILVRFFREPGLFLRVISGKKVAEFSLAELAKYVRSSPVIIEAGAADGEDSERFLDFWPGCRLYCLEPHPDLYEKLLARVSDRAHCAKLALAPTRAPTVPFYQTSDSGHSSSILRPTLHQDFFPEVGFDPKAVVVESITLDDFVGSIGVDAIGLLWLDLQGAELACLKGGGLKTLQIAETIHIEVARVATYENQATLRDVVGFLSAEGFELQELRAPFVFGNAIFTRSSGG